MLCLRALTTLYNDVEQRPEMVKQGLQTVGIERVLGSKEIERLAGWSTRAGVRTEIAGVKEVAAPYMEMNTKELVLQGAKLVNASILQPSYARVDESLLQPAKARATPYIAPYIARGLDTKDAVLRDERVQRAVASLKDKFTQVRERPADVARDLKTTAVDLIKYEKLGEYRSYVCSEHFVADTRRLVKEDLPALASEAARLGAHGVQAGAELMKDELAAASAAASEAWARGREEHSDLRSWEALSGLARVLVAAMSDGLASRAEEAELRAKLAAMTARLQSVFGLGQAATPAEAPVDAEDEAQAQVNKVVGFEVEAVVEAASSVAVSVVVAVEEVESSTLNTGAPVFIPGGPSFSDVVQREPNTDDGAAATDEEDGAAATDEEDGAAATDEEDDDDEYEDAPLSAEKPLM